MRWRTSQVHDDSTRAGFAGTISFVATLVVVTILLLAKSAEASRAPTVPAPGGVLAAPLVISSAAAPSDEDEAEAEASEDEEAEGEPSEDEDEEGWDEEGAGGEPPYECVLRTARGTVVVQEAQSKLRLQLAYTAFEPAPASVDFQLRGGKGSLRFNAGHRHLSESGVLRETETLSVSELARAVAARTVTVDVRVPGAPRYCSDYSERQLKTKRVAPGRVTWLQSGSVFGS
jgi:hypothetical protein